MSKEKEMRESSKESIEKESYTLTYTPPHARTREENQKMAGTIPTLAQVISHAQSTLAFNDEEFLTEWYREMDCAFWCDEFGNPMKNWGWILNKWRANRRLFERLRDPDRLPDARKGSRSKRKSDNWRATRKEDMDDVLG